MSTSLNKYDPTLLMPRGNATGFPSLRYVLSVVFRRSRFVITVFLAILLGIALRVLPQPPEYAAQMKLLLNRGRIDSAVSSDPNATPRATTSIPLEEVNTELELLRSQDLLRKVVLACGLHESQGEPSRWAALSARLASALGVQAPSRELRVEQAVLNLGKQLEVQPMRQSNLIVLSYASPDPAMSARVLNTLVNLYLGKHAEVHRPGGTFDFFQQETERYRKALRVAEEQLSNPAQPEAVSPLVVKEVTLRQWADFEAQLEQIRASSAVAEERIRALEKLAASIPSRAVSQIRSSSRSLESFQQTLQQLELKRAELSRLYQPGYPELQVVENQIAQTRTAMEALDKAPPLEQSTDRDPRHDWVMSELTKARAELAGLRAQAAATQNIVADYDKKARKLAQVDIATQALVREGKIAEANYTAIVRKQEDARISDELDRHRIVNVAIAQPAATPLLPAGIPKALLMLLGSVFAAGASIGLAFVVDIFDPSLRTPEEVQAYLNLPVAAVLPKSPLALPAAHQRNGNQSTTHGQEETVEG